MDKAIWETLKRIHIVEQHELEEQDEKQDSNEEVFYTALESPSQIITMEECFEFGMFGRQLLIIHHAKLMANLHE